MWVLPSLNRPRQLRECLRSMRETLVTSPGVVIIGPNQPNEADEIKHVLPKCGWSVICQHEDDHSLVDVLNRFVRDNPDLDYYGYLQDDLKFVTEQWDDKLIRAAGRTGMASSNDMWKAPRRNVGAGVFGGDLMRAWGFWGPSELRHCYIDDFWEDVGRKCDNWTVLMDVKQVHFHWSDFTGNRAPMDETYQVALDQMPEDGRIWEEYRRSKDYKELLNRVKALCSVS